MLRIQHPSCLLGSFPDEPLICCVASDQWLTLSGPYFWLRATGSAPAQPYMTPALPVRLSGSVPDSAQQGCHMLIHVTSGGWGLHPTQKTGPSVPLGPTPIPT